MDREELVRRLMTTFLVELDEHVRTLEHDLLALEKADDAARGGLLKTLFRTAHSLKGAARSVSVTPIEAVCHRMEGVLAAAVEGSLSLAPDHLQLFLAVADALRDAGQRLRESRTLDRSPIETILSRLQSPDLGTATPVAAPKLPPDAPQPAAPGTVRVAASKLDALLTRTGELVVARKRSEERIVEVEALRDRYERMRARCRKAARAAKAPADGLDDEMKSIGRDLDRLASDLGRDAHAVELAAGPLADEVRRVRMIRFAEACEGLDRAVRDLARSGGKEVDLVIEGAEVELDRSVLEAIKAPLLHLVRNAVDHGVEPPDIRRAGAKPPRARVRVSASLRGGDVEVAVEDDGGGLDLSAIRAQALRRGMAAPSGDAEAARLVFLAGFTTAKAVTEVSGRGIGLDIVKSAVEAIHGSVDFTHAAGKGCRFVLRLPLTLTSIRALLVGAGGHLFALPTGAVRRLVRVAPADLRTVEGREMLPHDGALVPLAGLAATLGLRAAEPAHGAGRASVVVLASAERCAGLVVDELRAEAEVVVKGLGPRLGRLPFVSGATVLPDGRTVLILNAAEVLSRALAAPAGPSIAGALAAPAAAKRKRLLVAEDSVTTRALLKGILETHGFDVLEAADGAEAWRLLQEVGADLVVSDVEMPRMDGFELTEAIRRSRRAAGLPVILVTARTSPADKARGLEAGADAYLEKSAFDQTRLLETIAQLL